MFAGEEAQEGPPALVAMVGPSKEILLYDEATGLLYYEPEDEEDEEPLLYGYYDAAHGRCVKVAEGMDELVGARVPRSCTTPLLTDAAVRSFERNSLVVLDGVVPANLVGTTICIHRIEYCWTSSDAAAVRPIHNRVAMLTSAVPMTHAHTHALAYQQNR